MFLKVLLIFFFWSSPLNKSRIWKTLPILSILFKTRRFQTMFFQPHSTQVLFTLTFLNPEGIEVICRYYEEHYGLRLHFRWHLRAHKLKILNYVTDTSSCSLYRYCLTHKWLKIGLKKPRIPEFYTLTKIHKKIPVGRPIVSGSSGPTERISSLLTHVCNPSPLNKSHI